MLGTSYTLNVYNIYLGAFSHSTMDLMDYLQIGSSYWYNTLKAYYFYDPKFKQRQYVTNGTSFAGRTTLLPGEKGLTLTVDDIVTLLYMTLWTRTAVECTRSCSAATSTCPSMVATGSKTGAPSTPPSSCPLEMSSKYHHHIPWHPEIIF